MLIELSIKNFAIIDEVSISFDDGLTVLTGETGAGKSIIIDAVQLLAGGRGSVEYVRHNTPKAEIEGLFAVVDDHAVHQVSEEYGVNIQDEMLVLHRTITAAGKSICRVNGKLVTLAILREFGKKLIDIHSQHESQLLMDEANHLDLLDLYDQKALSKTKSEYELLYKKFVSLRSDYYDLSKNEQEMNHRLDLLAFQMKELEEANLQPEEDITLEEERTKLQNFENIYLGVQTAYNALYGENKALEWLSIAQNALEENEDHEAFITEKAREMANHFYLIEEMSFELRDFRDQLHFEAHRLDEVEARLHEINRLKRKYGSTVNEMLEYMAKIEEEIDQIQNKDTHLTTLEGQMKAVAQDALVEAKQLHEIRSKLAEKLEKEIQEELQTLHLENVKFVTHFAPLEEIKHFENIDLQDINLHKNGLDQISFQISTNPGEPLRQLGKVASGGEISRIMLVMKKIFAKHQGVTSVIFDEVDTGVSGRVAQAMAEKLYQISADSQVLCITHLPQVAAMADAHKLIQKGNDESRVSTEVHDLSDQEKIEEVGKMITGSELTETALEHGEKLIKLALDLKKEN